MTSKFFAVAGDSSSDESEAEVQVKEEVKQPQQRRINFLEDDDSEEEAPARVMKTQKDKRFDSLRLIIKQITNHSKINDFTAILGEYENLVKEFEKSRKVVDKEGMPTFYIRALVDLEDTLGEITNEMRKKFKQANSKAFIALRSKFVKYKEEFAERMAAYREKPEESEEQEEEEEAEDEDSEEESEDEDEEEESEEESEEEQEEKEEEPHLRRLKWMKPEARAKYLGTELTVEKKVEHDKDTTKKPTETVKKELVETQIKREKIDLSLDSVKVQLKDLNEKRTRAKIKEYSEHIDLILRMLDAHPNEPVLRAHIISSLFQAHIDNPSSTVINEYLPRAEWHSLLKLYDELLNTLATNPKIELYEFTGRINELEEGKEEDFDNTLRGSLVGFYQYLDDQLFKSLKFTRGGTSDYTTRLRDLWKVTERGELVWDYYKSLKFESGAFQKEQNDHRNVSLAHIAIVLLNHLHYQSNTILDKIMGTYKNRSKHLSGLSHEQLLRSLVQQVNNWGSEIESKRAMLFFSFYYANNSQYSKAKELLQISQVTSKIAISPQSVQIPYNRVIVQIGLAAFRKGLYRECFESLNDIVSLLKRAREFLGQGVAKIQQEKTRQMVAQEQRRLLPYHMHLSIDEIETCYFLSAMLLEAPNISAAPYTIDKNMISRFYRRMMEGLERQQFIAPPVDTNDLLVRAANSLHNADWQNCISYVRQLRVWKSMRGVPQSDVSAILKNYEGKLKEVSLVVWIFMSADFFKSLSLQQLAEQFELNQKQVRALAGKLILKGKLRGYIDQGSQTLQIESTGEPSSLLHYVLFRLEKKVGQRSLLQNNEKLLAILEDYVKKAKEPIDGKLKGKLGRDGPKGGSTLQPQYKNPGSVKHTRKLQQLNQPNT